jgi:hypothetical protein
MYINPTFRTLPKSAVLTAASDPKISTLRKALFSCDALRLQPPTTRKWGMWGQIKLKLTRGGNIIWSKKTDEFDYFWLSRWICLRSFPVCHQLQSHQLSRQHCHEDWASDTLARTLYRQWFLSSEL